MFKSIFRKREKESDADALLNFADEASTTDKAPDPFHVTERAAEKIKSLVSEEKDATGLRIFVQGGGCSGFQYDFSIDTTKQPDDCVFIAHDVEIVIDAISLELVDTAELDYKRDLMGSYFAVNNPNATASCGCGTSFSV